jgi:hypothetical protein
METILHIAALILGPLFALVVCGIVFLIIAVIIQEVGRRLLRRRITRLESGTAAAITIVFGTLVVFVWRWL